MLETKKLKADVTVENISTPYQAAWDERLKKHKRFARNVNYTIGAFYALDLAVFAVLVSKILGLLSVSDDEARSAVTSEAGLWFAGFMVLTFTIAFASIPSLRAIGWSEWALGERPADDYKPREAKSLDVTIEKVNEDLRYFHVSGLYRPDENYTFKVERFKYPRSRQSEYSYKVSEKDNKIRLNHTMDSSCFKGMTEDEITKNLIDRISFQLDEKTDHFKELNYSI